MIREATRVVAKIPAGPYDNANHAFLIGRADSVWSLASWRATKATA